MNRTPAVTRLSFRKLVKRLGTLRPPGVRLARRKRAGAALDRQSLAGATGGGDTASRPVYFDGKLLSARDLTTDQDY